MLPSTSPHVFNAEGIGFVLNVPDARLPVKFVYVVCFVWAYPVRSFWFITRKKSLGAKLVDNRSPLLKKQSKLNRGERLREGGRDGCAHAESDINPLSPENRDT